MRLSLQGCQPLPQPSWRLCPSPQKDPSCLLAVSPAPSPDPGHHQPSRSRGCDRACSGRSKSSTFVLPFPNRFGCSMSFASLHEHWTRLVCFCGRPSGSSSCVLWDVSINPEDDAHPTTLGFPLHEDGGSFHSFECSFISLRDDL